MKAKYIITLSLVISLVVGVFFIEPPIAYLFFNSKGDCSSRSLFMYSAIYQNKTEKDVVLFGSSKTMCGINDSLLNQIGKERILNLGYCRFGRNLDMFFIKEYCKTHHPKKIVLEVRQIESGETHPLTPFLMPLNAFSFNQNIIEDLYNKWLCNLKYSRNKIFAKTKLASFPQLNQYGYWQRNTTAHLPDLLKEFYLWHIVQNALGMLGGLFLCFIAYKIIKLTGDEESNYMTDCEIFGKHIGFGTILISGFFSIGGIVFIMTSIYGLVFIIVAPKLYLIEYFIR